MAFGDRQAVALVDHGEPVDLVFDAVIENARGLADRFRRMGIVALFEMDDQLGIAMGDAGDGLACAVLEMLGDTDPLNVGRRGCWFNIRNTFGHRVEAFGRCVASDEVGVQVMPNTAM